MSRSSSRLLVALAAAGACIAAMSVPSGAEAMPRANETWWDDCVLNGNDQAIDTVAGLIADMQAAGKGNLGPDVEVAYVEIHTFQDNNGQPLSNGNTGVVICRNPGETQPPVIVNQTDNIGGSGADLDLLDVQNGATVRYQLNGVIEKRHCETVEGMSTCREFVPVQ